MFDDEVSDVLIQVQQAEFFRRFLDEFERKILPVFAARGYTKGMALLAFLSYHTNERLEDVIDVVENNKEQF